MSVSVGFLTIMVSVALGVTLVAPIALMLLWLRDWRKGKLW